MSRFALACALVLAVSAVPASASAEEPAPDRAAFEAEADRCFSKLRDALVQADYTFALELEWDLEAPSIVDATEALAAERGVDVALLTDGQRMHAVGPFLTHGRARSLVRYATNQTDQDWRRLCIFARAVQEDAGMRASQRTLLGVIAGVGGFGFGAGLLLLARSERHKAAAG